MEISFERRFIFNLNFFEIIEAWNICVEILFVERKWEWRIENARNTHEAAIFP